MNPVFGILLAAVLFAVFGAFHRRGEASDACGTDPNGCDKADEAGGCSACHVPTLETPESSHGRF